MISENKVKSQEGDGYEGRGGNYVEYSNDFYYHFLPFPDLFSHFLHLSFLPQDLLCPIKTFTNILIH